MIKGKGRRRLLIQLAILAAAVAALAPQFRELAGHKQLFGQVNYFWLAAAFVLVLFSNIFAALAYMSLNRQLPFGRTFIVQTANLFANRLLPGGIGALGLNTLYIARQTKTTKTAAGTTAAANNLLGIGGFMGLALIVIAIEGPPSNWQISNSEVNLVMGLAVAVLILAVALAEFFKGLDMRLNIFFNTVKRTLVSLAREPLGLAGCIAANLGISFCYIAALWCSLHAMDINLTRTMVLIVFAAGNLAFSLSPTPGGLGPTELAMTAALAGAGVDSTTALLAVLCFRLSTFWLPIIPGFIAFRYSLKQAYFSVKGI